MLRLEQSYLPDAPGTNGALRLRLFNTGTAPLRIDSLAYTALLRPGDGAEVRGGTLLGCFANKVGIAAPEGLDLAPGAHWEVTLSGLNMVPRTRSELPVCLLPWPARFACTAFGPARKLCPADAALMAPLAEVAALHRRLFPAAPAIATLERRSDAIAVRAEPGDLPPEGYRLTFGPEITLHHADRHGLRHGLIALAQMVHAAATDPRFHVPTEGEIEDAPRHGWRGMHLDVARNFIDAPRVSRLLDILAWHRMNRFHWHLTDDEGWRLPVAGLPELTEIGARRALGHPLSPQFAEGAAGQEGSYSEAEIRALVAHGRALGIEILPEIDLPGHSTALLAALPHLADPQEPPDSYRSIQGYPNNAINPGLPETWAVLDKIFAAVVELFPFATVHLGGDEVDAASWSASPKARAWADEMHVQSAAIAMQSACLRRCQAMLGARGRRMGGWDECAGGGGVECDALLFAWRSREMVAALIEEGYDVVATPGQHYYLDMAQGAGWDSPGLTWAGISPLEECYAYDAGAGLPDGPGRLAGVEACMWGELIDSTARFNHMAFPRLSAVAESGWTPVSAKNWPRFAALSRLMPRL